MKGARAAANGASEAANPYKVDRGKTWRASYRAAWLRGHRSVARPSE